MRFHYRGRIPSSKSILNRLLVIQSFAPELRVIGDSDCDDVVKMRSALQALLTGGLSADCGAAGTTFRFLAARASRIPGERRLIGSSRLLQRPQTGLVHALSQLGVNVELSSRGLVTRSDGWKQPRSPLRIDRSSSSQFASAVLLSSWDLDFDLEVRFEGVERVADGMSQSPSEGYLEMTLELMRAAGMRVESDERGFRVLRGSRVSATALEAEIDLSSSFAVAALATVGGEAIFEAWPIASLQPDRVFPEILERMGAHVSRRNGQLSVSSGRLRSVDVDLGDCPDLFPVLSVLCALADGRSCLYGAPHLKHKESSRIETSAQLLRLMGRDFIVRPDGMEILGQSASSGFAGSEIKDFDPADDHRLAMAAAVARLAGAPVRILHPHVVDKSFPKFWEIFERGGGQRL